MKITVMIVHKWQMAQVFALAMIEGILGYLDFNAEVVDFGIAKDGYGIEPLPPRKPYEPVSKK